MKKILPALLIIVPLTLIVVLGAVNNKSKLTSVDTTLAESDTKKEISKYPPRFADITGGFTDINSPPEYLTLGSEYWVRLTINGKDTTTRTYSGSDIMLVLDVTGSMAASYPIGPSRPGVNTSRLQAAKQALRSFADDAQSNDNIGFGTFVLCNPLSQRYATSENNIPMTWSYEESVSGKRAGYGYVHIPLRTANGTQISQINSLLSDTGTTGVLRLGSNNQIIFCPDPSTRGAQTDLGGGITVGLSQLTNLVQSQRRTDGTLFRSSNGGAFQSPSFRSDKKRYIVIATDGEENIYPLAYDTQPIIQQLNNSVQNAVEYAKRNNIVIYTISIEENDSSFAEKLNQIATDTGGKYFKGRNRDELIQSYSRIYDEVVEDSTTGTIAINENINTTFFSILDLNPVTNAYNGKFYVSKPVSGTEMNITNDVCGGGSCIVKNSSSSYTFNLPAIKPDEKYYIYFKVEAKGTSLDPVPIDGAGSNVVYSPTVSSDITNKSVAIDNPQPFFQSSNGDIYSKGTITNNLRDGELMQYGTESLSLSKNPINTGSGKINPYQRKAIYEVNKTDNYESFETLLKSQTEVKNISSRPLTKADLTPSDPAQERYIVKISTPDRYVEFQGTTNFNDNITRIVFIDGDLYITRSNYQITKNGKNGLIFIVSGNIGIDPAIEKIEGLFIANGIIDTACSFASKFAADECLPLNADQKLIAEGSYISISGGLKLQRVGQPIGTVAERDPGEEFIYRPDLAFNATGVIGKILRTWKERVD